MGKHLDDYFIQNGYRVIAIYGMSYIGEPLLSELEGTKVKVAYGIDRNAVRIYTDIDIISIEEPLAKVDAVVIIAITFYDEIKQELKEKIDCLIISLKDILYGI